MNSAQRTGTIILGIAVLAVFSISIWWILTPPPLFIQGEVEAKEVQVSSKIAARVSAIPVKEGQNVKKNELLVQLESPEIQAKLIQSSAAQKAAMAEQKKAHKGARQEEIRSAYNAWQTAEANSDLAEKTFARIKKLHKEGVVPGQQMDEAEAKHIAARKTANAAKARYDMAVAGARREDKEAADAMVAKAQGAVSEVKAYLNETKLTAPVSAEVSSINAEQGELVSPGFPVVSLVDLSDIWVTFQLREDLLTRIRMGTILPVKFPALGENKYPLVVTYISPMGDFATWRATKARGDFDLKTFEVHLRPKENISGLRPGMSGIVNWDELPETEKKH